MDGVHDVGGMHGFGPVEREEHEPPFHGRWEAAVVAIMRATRGAGLYNVDEFRHSIERMAPAHYLGSSYFEHWLDGIVRLLDEKDVIAADEVEARAAFVQAGFGETLAPPSTRGFFARAMTGGAGADTSFRAPAAPPRHAVGDPVMTRNFHPAGHTRLPRYARGKRGVVAAHRGCHVFPDTHAHGLGEQPQHVYSVRFDASELWEEAAEPNQCVYLDLWESYLGRT
jgi:nitrile hydratase subunit beta